MDIFTLSANNILKTGAHRRYKRLVNYFELKYPNRIISFPFFKTKFKRFLLKKNNENKCYLIVFSYKNIILSLFLILFYKKVNIICFIRQDPILYEPYITFSGFEKFSTFISTLIIKYKLVNTKIIAQTYEDAKSIIKKYKYIEKCEVIPNNINLDSTNLKNWLNLSRKNIKKGKKYNIVFIGGSFNIRKNFNLVKNFIVNIDKMSSAKEIKSFTLIGNYSNSDLVKLKNILSNKGISLYHIAKFNKIDEIIKSNTILIHSSFVDSFPNLLTEAIENYIPFISSKISVAESLIIDKNILFNAKSIQSLNKSLNYLIKLISSNDEKEIFSSYCNTLNFNWEERVHNSIKEQIDYDLQKKSNKNISIN